MRGEDMVDVWFRYPFLRQAIVRLARSFVDDPRHQRWLITQAWIRISQELGHDKTERYYLSEAYCRMRHKYEVYLMPEPKPWRKRSEDPGIQRARYHLRRITAPIHRQPPKNRAYNSVGIYSEQDSE
jgi:hypothetical protein